MMGGILRQEIVDTPDGLSQNGVRCEINQQKHGETGLLQATCSSLLQPVWNIEQDCVQRRC